MFDEFRRAWREAVDNFWRELEAEEGGPRGVYREVASARNQLERLDREIAECRQRVALERKEAAACERRRRLADGIGDAETARIAAEYGTRHRERAAVLERKAEALEAERALCRRDLDGMEQALQEGGYTGAAAPELDDLTRHPAEGDFRTLEDSERSRSAEERLAELKRRMGRQ